ncbi:alpha/beta hydrolase [Agromyces mangrovi Wang et al. 2018]|uniref:alpha/beta hydrolase n=1 Tax=Agromyces mangrovi TaxID=1858653 RepID=UPI002573B08F|nr:alpha/beta hydrolase [Agromyces mangrovi]BDZ63985.1 alpha/beta hydrolase [Agromyces mangrovi]
MRRALGWIAAAVAVLLLLVLGFVMWTQTVFQGEREAALEAWRDPAIEITSTPDSVVMQPVDGGSGTGLVFIPGAKVDPYAYLRVLSGVVDAGATVVITKPTLNLAFFDFRSLDAFTAAAPDVDEWWVGGHSLGGVRACMLAGDPESDASGLVLFGSYCANDLADSGLEVLSISGSNDGLTTPDDVTGNAHLLPDDAVFVELEGANHADFGDYGVQPGDGESTMPRDESLEAITAALEAALLGA